MLLVEQFHNLTLNPANTARLKELVLQLAVQGKLTEAWRKENPDVEPAAELLKKIKEEKAQLVQQKSIDLIIKETAFTLPQDWIRCRLGDLVEIKYGKSLTKAQTIENGKYPVYGSNGIVGFYNENLTSKNTIIIGRKGSAGALNICFGPSWTTDVAYYIEEVEGINVNFLFRLLKTLKLDKLGKGIKPGLNRNEAYILPIALPPLAEQEAIVARVEELFKNIEALQEKTAARIQLKKQLGAAALQNLTTATAEDLAQNWQFLKDNFPTIFDEAANVKKLRETILQLAVQGKLTQAWRHQNPHPEPASELLKRIQAEKAQLVKEKKIKSEKPSKQISEDEMPYELPESWVWCRLGDVAESFNNGLYKHAKYYTNQGIISLRMYNIQEGTIRFQDLKRVELTEEEFATYALKENDILLNRVNSAELIGKAAIIPKYAEGLVYESMNIRIKLILKNQIADYINIFLRTSFAREYMRFNAKHAIGQSSVNQTTVSNLLLPLPPLAEQEAIVAQVDELMQLCDELEQQIQQSKKETEALMQAVVQEALQVQEEVVL